MKNFVFILLLFCILFNITISFCSNFLQENVKIFPYPLNLTRQGGLKELCFSGISMNYDSRSKYSKSKLSKKLFSYLDKSILRNLGTTFTFDSNDKFFEKSESRMLNDGVKFSIKVDDYSIDLNDIVDLDKNKDNNLESYNLKIEEYPNIKTQDSTELKVTLHSKTVWGALYGITSFFQMLKTKKHSQSPFPVACISEYLPITIYDSPRFKWRGLMIDSARHFLTIETIQNIIDGLSNDKMNTLHWHITDAQSFPIKIDSRLKLLEKSLWHKNLFYTKTQIESLIQYAKMRGVRIIPEIDIPGHTYSWGKAYEKITTNCPNYLQNIRLGNINVIPLNPVYPETYQMAKDVFKFLSETFEDNYIHIGGDEVIEPCWNEDTVIQDFIQHNTEGVKTNDDLWAYFQSKFQKQVWETTDPLSNKIQICWEELVLNLNSTLYSYPLNNIKTKKKQIVQSWIRENSIREIVKKGYPTIFSGGFYLDRQKPVDSAKTRYLWGDTWIDMYNEDPSKILDGLTQQEKNLYIGGEACMWSEQINTKIVQNRIWPRLSAVAERLWSPQWVNSTTNAQKRIIHHRCYHLLKNGIKSFPLRPDFCPFEFFKINPNNDWSILVQLLICIIVALIVLVILLSILLGLSIIKLIFFSGIFNFLKKKDKQLY